MRAATFTSSEVRLTSNFPDFGGQGSTSEPSYAFICELNSTCTDLIYGDFIGQGVLTNPSVSGTRFIKVGVDNSGDAYAMGVLAGPDFPAVGATPTNPGGVLDPYSTGPFLLKVNPAGDKLLYCQLLGLGVEGLDVDSLGDCYLYGYPLGCEATPGAFDTIPYYTGTPDASFQSMVAKIDPTGRKLLYATYLPMMFRVYYESLITINDGPAVQEDASIAVDAAGEAVVIGSAESGFPTTPGALFPTSLGNCDVVAKLNATGTGLVYATYLGSGPSGRCFATGYNPYESPGAENNWISMGGFAVAEDAGGNVAVSGETDKTNFPETVPSDIGPDPDQYPVWVYLLKLNAKGGIDFSRYLGWMTPITPYGVGIDTLGDVIVGCNAISGFNTTADAIQPEGPTDWTEPYVVKYDPTGKTLIYGTYYGTPAESATYGTILWSLNMSPNGVAVITGAVSSTAQIKFPTTPGAYETTMNPLATKSGTVYEAGFLAGVSLPVLSASLTIGAPDSGGKGDFLATLRTSAPLATQNTLVYIQSSNTNAVPPSVLNLPAGSDSENFLIETKPVTATTTVTISAILFGQTYKATLVLQPAKLTNFYVSPTSVIGGMPSDAVIRFAATAPTTGNTVAISSAKPVSMPSSITVPGGELAASARITTVGVSAAVTVPLKATFGTQNLSASLTVLPAPLKSLLPSSSVIAGGTSLKMTVILDGNPGPSGDSIALTHTGPLSMQSSVNIPASEEASSFMVTAEPVAVVTTSKVTAGFGGSTLVATITIEPAMLTAFYVMPTAVIGGQPSDGVLKLNGEAYSTGDVVSISASGPVTLPATVKIPGGWTATSFPFKTSAVSSTTVVRITAKLASTSLSASITVNPAVLTGFTLAATTVVGGKGTTGTISLNGPAGPGGDLVAISAAGPVSFTHYAIIPQNASSVTFPIATNAVTTKTAVKFSVVLGSVTLSQTLTITP